MTRWSSKLLRNTVKEVPENYDNYLIILENNVITYYIFPSLNHLQEEEMEYKQFDDSMSFADTSSMEKNRRCLLCRLLNPYCG